MKKNQNFVFGPDDKLSELDSGDFQFSSSKELLSALTTPSHPLFKHAKWIKGRLQCLSVESTELIRVDCAFDPPVVETVNSRSVIHIISLAAVLAIAILVIVY